VPKRTFNCDGAPFADPAIQRLRDEFPRDGPKAVLRWNAHNLFQVPLWEGVDLVASRARDLFEAVPPVALATESGASDRELFRHALNLCRYIVMLAYMMDGRKEHLDKIAFALQTGFFAVLERDRGFDEPFLRARQKSPDEPRESLYVRRVKAASAEACEALREFGMKDAARQVADIINRNEFLPLKANGKAVGARTIKNWVARLHTGELSFFWGCENWGSLFPNAYRLYQQGRPEAARRRVIRYLPVYIKEAKRVIMGN
jgi:hypothetical protein